MALKTGVYVCIVAQRSTNKTLLYKHRWNTRWAFARKHDIFTRENNHMWKDHLTLGTRGFSRVPNAEAARVTIKTWQKLETALEVSGTQGSISKTQFKHRTFHVSNLIPSIK